MKYNLGINITFTCGLSLQENFSKIMNVLEEIIMEEKSNNFEICFEVVDFEAFIEKFKSISSLEYLHDVIEYDWGQRVILFYDLDNHLIEVGENMAYVVKKFAKQGLSTEEIVKKTQHPLDFVLARL